MSESDKKPPKGLIPREKKSSYIHIRVDPDFKDQVTKKAMEEEMNLTNFVVLALEEAIYEKDVEEEEKEEEEEEEEDFLLEEILTAMENLERRMEIRLATLQDAFNSLIGKLLDFERSGASLARGRKKGKAKDSDDEESFDFELDNVLQTEPEKLIYQRVKRYIESKGSVGRLPPFSEIVAHLETDKKLKEYLIAQDKNFPGWKDTLIRDAIDEAIDELGIPVYGGID